MKTIKRVQFETTVLCALLFIFVGYVAWSVSKMRDQKRTINELIELNHDKSVFIDNGRPGRYEGSEEELPPTPTIPREDCDSRDDNCSIGECP